MPKLILSFKGRALYTHNSDEDEILIGREPDCDLPIDSLSIGPKHARIRRIEGGGYELNDVDDGFPVLLNGNRLALRAELKSGDQFEVGKYTLEFSDDADEEPRLSVPMGNNTAGGASAEAEDDQLAYIQVCSGPMIGRVVSLRRAVTRLGHVGMHDLIVTRRHESYRLSMLEPAHKVVVNGHLLPADKQLALDERLDLRIDGVRVRFFGGKPSEEAEPSKGPAPA